MLRLDNRTEEEIRRVIEWIFSNPDPFWSTNILSTEKLRKQFDKIIIQMSKRKPVDVKETADKKKVELMRKNQQIAKLFVQEYEGHSSIRVKAGDHCIEIFTVGRNKNQTTMLGYAENGFREQVESFLRKLEDR